MSQLHAAIAANRFGLGARPGELRAIAADPRGWLLAQLVPEQELPAPLRALPGTADDLAAFFVWLRDYISAQPGAGMAAASAATTVEQSYVRALLPRYAAAVEARVRTAVTSDTPFRERLVRFWSNHFVVSAAKPVAIALPPSYERDVARRFVVGRFADMLRAAEKHPAMLLFLDNVQSIGPNSVWARHPERMSRPRAAQALAPADAPRGLNENLAREILELHTLGVDGGYTQADVTAFACVLTGWRIADPYRQWKLKRFANWTAEDFHHFEPDAHEPGPQRVLGATYAQPGVAQGEAVLDALARHPSTARFLATKLARHFAGDVPPPPLVDRLARAFLASEGDLRAVARTLVESPEPWAPGPLKFKPPEDFLVSALRALGGPPLTGLQLVTLLGEMGQRPYFSPGPDGWKDVASEWLAPDALWKRIEWAQLAGRAMARGSVDPLATADAVLGPTQDDEARAAIGRAESAAQGLALLLASPAFMRR